MASARSQMHWPEMSRSGLVVTMTVFREPIAARVHGCGWAGPGVPGLPNKGYQRSREGRQEGSNVDALTREGRRQGCKVHVSSREGRRQGSKLDVLTMSRTAQGRQLDVLTMGRTAHGRALDVLTIGRAA